MIVNLKHNTRIKLISLLSSIFLWMYVMAVVDPEETTLYENVPISINNMSQLTEEGLVIYPSVDLETDIYITGKLSRIQKLDKDDIHIYGSFEDISEGDNELTLRASISEQVAHEFKNKKLKVTLEKYIEEDKNINIKIEDQYIDDIDQVYPEVQSVRVSGPRSKVDSVYEVRALLTDSNMNDDYNETLKLIPIDKNGKEVDDVKLEKSNINVSVKLLKSKVVPINIKIKDNSDEIDVKKDLEINESTIAIKGQKSIIDSISSIDTLPIDINDLTDEVIEVKLDIPDGVYTDKKIIEVKLKKPKTIKEIFNFTSEDIIIVGQDEESEEQISLPEAEISVEVEYEGNDENISKDDIELYIDVQESKEDEQYKIKYRTEKEYISIKIDPENI